jgi:dCMP deaminase
MRVNKDLYYLNIAEQVALRSSCLRSAYGAVIVKHDSIISTGYNGSCRGAVNCCDVGRCNREGADHRTEYDKCLAVHAEINAMLSCRSDLEDSIVYIFGKDIKTSEPLLGIKALPCWQCYRAMTNVRIHNICILDDKQQPIRLAMDEFSFVDPQSFPKGQ